MDEQNIGKEENNKNIQKDLGPINDFKTVAIMYIENIHTES
jgi:hypothetical protein|tara:strand:+ start:841 stop:963 length:123 start_codon:yes stop_codon:yes gene_type:complete